MLSQLQTSYQRLEQSLQRLTDSIAAYNPSATAAEELVAADDTVNEDLGQLVIHQTNHLRIQELRQTTDSLDETIKATVRLIADARKDIAAIPSTTTTEPRREVKVDELLAYAKFISKTSVAPTPVKQPPPAKSQAEDNTNTRAQITNGIATPPPGLQDSENQAFARSEDNVGMKALSQESKEMLALTGNLPFEPWPSFTMMQQGALGNIQGMIERGEDPAKVLSPEEQVEADRRKAEEEERERKELEERERRRMSMMQDGAGRRSAQVDVFDPDEM